tara:strand:- start:109 stop:1224 length:1116 start_codon:yes stop_codon:yes gene_type:complete
MNRVKKLREEKIKEETIAEVQKQQEDILAELKKIEIKESPKYSNWRRELQETITMSTNDIMTTTLPARGDVDLEAVTQTATPGTDNSGGSDGTYSFGDYDGTGNGGFVFRLDTRKYDTLKFSASGGNATRIELSVGDEDFQTLSSGTNTITISSANRGQNVLFTFNAFKSGGSGATGASISGTAFQRRTNISTGIRLDDPDANAFVRMGDMNNLSAEERKKKLKDMLDAGNEYLTKYTNVTPSQTAPGDIELASHDKPFSKYPAAGGDDKWPGLPQDSIKDYLHPSKDPLLDIPITPFGFPRDQKAQTGGTKVALAPTGDPSKAPPPIYDPMNPGMPRRPGSDGRPFNAPIGPQPLYPMVKKGKKTKTMVA